jgi:hypothetical protein
MAQPVNEALVALEEMAQGNLDRTMDGIYQGDYARLQEAVNGDRAVVQPDFGGD